MSSKMLQEIRGSHEVSRRFMESDWTEYARLRSMMSTKKQLILMGTGASLNACKTAQFAFMRNAARIPHVIPASDIGLLDACLDADTLVILVSQSGQSYETQLAVEYLKKREVTVWGITNHPDSALGKGADAAFLMNAGEEYSSATKTYIATLLILFALAGAGDAGFPARLGRVPEDVRETIAVSEAKVRAWAEGLAQRDKFYVLGAGAFGVTAQQGALVLKEKTFLHAEGMSISEFRHGNIEVVQDGLPIIVIAAADRLDESVKHAEFMASLSAEVYLIADRPVRPDFIPEERILVLPEQTDPVLAQIPAVLPLMILAENIAGIKGLDIDGFRYISKVVDQY